MPAPFVPYPHDVSVTTTNAYNRGFEDARAGDESLGWITPRMHTATLLAYLAGRDEGGRYTARQTAPLPVQSPDAQTP